MEITGYILISNETNNPIDETHYGQISIYPRIEHALIEANKTIDSVRAVKCKVVIE